MSAVVKAFPSTRHVVRMAQAIEHMDKLNRRQEHVFNSRFMMPLALELKAGGLTQEQTARELEVFYRTVLDEVMRRTLQRCQLPEDGGAA